MAPAGFGEAPAAPPGQTAEPCGPWAPLSSWRASGDLLQHGKCETEEDIRKTEGDADAEEEEEDLRTSPEEVCTLIQELELRGLNEPAAWLVDFLPRHRAAFAGSGCPSAFLQPRECGDLPPQAFALLLQLRPLLQRQAFAAAECLLRASVEDSAIRVCVLENSLLAFLHFFLTFKTRASCPGAPSAACRDEPLAQASLSSRSRGDADPESLFSSLVPGSRHAVLETLASDLTSWLSASPRLSPSSSGTSCSPSLSRSQQRGESYLWWLLGVVRRAQNDLSLAFYAFLRSLRANPLNIACWRDFASLVAALRFGGAESLASFSSPEPRTRAGFHEGKSRADGAASLNSQRADAARTDAGEALDSEKAARGARAASLLQRSFTEGVPSEDDGDSDFDEDDELVHALEEASGGKALLEGEKAAVAWVGGWASSASARAYSSFLRDLALPQHFMTRVGYALVCMHTQRHAEAAKHYHKLALAFPDVPYLYAQLAKCSYELKSYSYSLKFFSALHKLAPHRLDYADDLSHIYFMRKEAEALGQLTQKCFSIDPHAPQTLCVLGNFLSAKGDHRGSIRSFKQATKLAPRLVSAWVALGHAFVEAREVVPAVRAYEAATRADPGDCRGWSGLAQVYALLGNWSLGVAFFQKACDARPTEPRLWIHLGDGLARLGRDEEAIRAYEQAWFCAPQIETATRLFRCFQDRDSAWGVAASTEGAQWAFAVVERFLLRPNGSSEAASVFRMAWSPLLSSPPLLALPPQRAPVILAVSLRGAPDDVLDCLLYLAYFSRLCRDATTAQQLLAIGRDIGGPQGEEIVQLLGADRAEGS
ncbi:tetratricopeptide repeat-containing protein [Besnoitia besnoiti]|uniref:Tetratricopeptide repeat-containing protein n=1 Tax=Besnoitia besnoiti TaxID=94643 RepID=A0A2A9MAT9_BESBE|nr:tetratricopeptide repeat-containing protein [Besnoitia besnoiti]PFH32490.1 tetratricopeptide repeat-containing protein [Besnoitia besnoiti]